MDFPKSAYVQAQCVDQKFPGTFRLRSYTPGDNDDPSLFKYPWRIFRPFGETSLKEIVADFYRMQFVADRVFQTALAPSADERVPVSLVPRFIDNIEYLAPDGTVTPVHPEVAHAIVIHEKPEVPQDLLPKHEELSVIVRDWQTHDDRESLRRDSDVWTTKVQWLAEATFNAPSDYLLNGMSRLPKRYKAHEPIYTGTNLEIFESIKEWRDDSTELFKEEAKSIVKDPKALDSLDYLMPNLWKCTFAKVGDDEVFYNYGSMRTLWVEAGNNHLGHQVELDWSGLWLGDHEFAERFHNEIKERINDLQDGLYKDIQSFIEVSAPNTVQLKLNPGQSVAHAYVDQVLVPALEILCSKNTKTPADNRVKHLVDHFDDADASARRAIRNLDTTRFDKSDFMRFSITRKQLPTVKHLQEIETALSTRIKDKTVLMRTMDSIALEVEKVQDLGQELRVDISAFKKALEIVADRMASPER